MAVQERGLGSIMQPAEASGATTRELVRQFLIAKRAAGRADKTLEKYAQILERFARSHRKLPTDPDPITGFLVGITGELETIDTYCRTLSSFYSWLGRRRIVARNPMPEVERPRLRDKVPRILEPDQLRQLLLYPGHTDRDRALLFFLVDTGARVGEAAHLALDDLYESHVILRGKTGEHFAPISPEVRSMLVHLPRHPRSTGPWVFLNSRQGGRLLPSSATHIVMKSFRRAGLRGRRYSAHALRHTFGTLWEGDELVLQQILGHRKLAMVQRYRRFRIRRAVAQHAVHSPLAQLSLW